MSDLVIASWRMLPASEPTLAASTTTLVTAPVRNRFVPRLRGWEI